MPAIPVTLPRDVYKRQGLWRFAAEDDRSIYPEQEAQRSADPVSYTHLDVYKRQVKRPSTTTWMDACLISGT